MILDSNVNSRKIDQRILELSYSVQSSKFSDKLNERIRVLQIKNWQEHNTARRYKKVEAIILQIFLNYTNFAKRIYVNFSSGSNLERESESMFSEKDSLMC